MPMCSDTSMLYMLIDHGVWLLRVLSGATFTGVSGN